MLRAFLVTTAEFALELVFARGELRLRTFLRVELVLFQPLNLFLPALALVGILFIELLSLRLQERELRLQGSGVAHLGFKLRLQGAVLGLPLLLGGATFARGEFFGFF